MPFSVKDYRDQPLAVEVKDVTMIFNMASESLTNLKEYFIKLAKHQLSFVEFRALKHISFEVSLVQTDPASQPCLRLLPAYSSLLKAR